MGGGAEPFLRVIEASGDPYEIGHALGRFGAAAVHGVLRPGRHWRATAAFAGSSRLARMEALVAAHFPAVHAELAGLADGLGVPFAELFAWNCRGDLVAAAPDGCTTVMRPGAERRISHNEDGLPDLAGHCGLVTATPDSGVPFAAFVYPGSIPGHTFTLTGRGMILAVNNIRADTVAPGVPRMVLMRAVLGATSLDAAVDLLAGHPRAGGFHVSLGMAGDPRLLGVEFTARRVSVNACERPAVHTNHLMHPAMATEPQLVTASSAARQARGEALLEGSGDDAILADRGGSPGLPILRDAADDPDEENTLATTHLVAGAGSAEGTVHRPGEAAATFSLSLSEATGRIQISALEQGGCTTPI
jgi:hypothetical protein